MLTSGSLLGEYQVLGRLGAGGMGEVYRALDQRLGREVALKLLPDEVAHSPEKRRRFEREARTLAAFHHPGIVTLYGFEDAGSVLCLVMELVEGPTLADRLTRGPIPLKEALPLAGQVAEALEAAHDRGILHRDLKPSNIKITPEGRIKLIDFGLAKGLESQEWNSSKSRKSTASQDSTGFGVLVGTAPYMSPEQARGESMDHRTDVWAFGCVLYEMLTGRRAFPGNSRMEAVAAVLDREPAWDALPAATPPSIRRLLKRTLDKDRAHRLHDIGDALLEIEGAQVELSSGVTSSAVTPIARRRRSTLVWTIGLLAATAITGMAAWLVLRTSAPAPRAGMRLILAPPPRVQLFDETQPYQRMALSPQGDRAAFMGVVEGQEPQLYTQSVRDIQAHAIPNTEGAHSPFFSADGEWLGYQQGRQLKKVLLEGGAALIITDLPGEANLRGASWGEDGMIVFSPGKYQGLWRVSQDGGKPQIITTPDTGRREISHRWPQTLPGGKNVLFTIVTGAGVSGARIGLLSLETGRWRVLLEGTGFARYSPTGHIIFGRLGTLYAERFDLSRLVVAGPAVPVLDDVQMPVGAHFYADFDISPTGALLYVPGFPHPVDRSLLWVDRQGRTSPATATRLPYSTPRLSPDGRRVAVTIRRDPETADLWLLDLERGTKTRLAANHSTAVWSSDGQWLVAQDSVYSFVRIRADGSSPMEALHEPRGNVNLDAWSSDGSTFVFSQQNQDTDWDLLTLPAAGGTPSPLLVTPYLECCATISPDGRYMAYVSKESDTQGQAEIYVSPFAGPVEKRYHIYADGAQPLFSRDGRELLIRGRGDRPKFLSIPVDTRGSFHAGTPRTLFDDTFAHTADDVPAQYDVSPDGQRFLFVEEPPAAPGPSRLVLIPDWAGEQRAKLQATRP